ncbi:MAG: hypothetical protein GXP26_00545 [Planctomycetes bacterium]|nr:hypothetical protein [Planctomycetota bacterium]
MFAGCESGERGSVRGVSGGDMDGQHRLQPPDHAQKERKNKPAQQLPKIVSGGGQQGVDLVARFTRSMIATQPVVALELSARYREPPGPEWFSTCGSSCRHDASVGRARSDLA